MKHPGCLNTAFTVRNSPSLIRGRMFKNHMAIACCILHYLKRPSNSFGACMSCILNIEIQTQLEMEVTNTK